MYCYLNKLLGLDIPPPNILIVKTVLLGQPKFFRVYSNQNFTAH